jgi:2'-5' RNA ligase
LATAPADGSFTAAMRAFIAIKVEPALWAELGRVQRKLDAVLPANAVRWLRPEQMHLTLKFLGAVPDEKRADVECALARACAGARALPLGLEGVGCFPGPRNPRVVWTGITGDVPTLRELQDRIERQTAGFGDHAEARQFRPHLTIGRVQAKEGRTARQIGDAVEAARVGCLGEWTARELVLFQSQLAPRGASYTELAVVRLV